MADAIKKEFQVESTLIEGANGVFDVTIDGSRIWSKHEAGRFPEHGEIIERIRSVTAGK